MNLRTPIQEAPISSPVFSEKDDLLFGPIELKRFICTPDKIEEADTELNEFLSNNQIFIMGITSNNTDTRMITTLTFRRVTKVKKPSNKVEQYEQLLQAVTKMEETSAAL